MKKHTSRTNSAALLLLTVSPLAALMLFAPSGTRTAPDEAVPREIAAAPIAVRTTAQVREAYGRMPLSFEANRGQVDEKIDFVARGPGYAVALSPTQTVFVLREAGEGVRTEDASHLRKISNSPSEPDPQSTVLRMNLVGANRAATVAGQNELEGRVNYLIGNDPAKWRTDVPTFGRVRYAEVYPGIDVVYYGNQRRLEYDFVVAPGSDADAIALEFAGAQRMEVEAGTGDLLLGIGEKTIRQHKPVVYQETSAGRREVEGRYAIRSGGRVGFEVGEYDVSAALIIDPVLEYSTYLGGNSGEDGCSIAVDSAGNAYVAGFTQSTNFPGTAPNEGDHDVFVTKINAAGTALVYSTYFGGSLGESGPGLAIDSAGNAYITGNTGSTDFPTVNPIQDASGGNQDAFVTKLNAAGTALVYSTYLGGSSGDSGNAIAVDSAGNAYIVGITSSTNFPTANAIDGTLGGEIDAFVAKINAAGTALVYSTYLGGSAGDAGLGVAIEFGLGIAVDSAGNAYVAGHTDSTDFPTVSPIQSTKGSDSSDAFVTKINPAGTALVYSTYLGGAGDDEGNAIALDSAGNAYITGSTNSTNFPLATAFQSTYGGDDNLGFGDVFVTKINPAGTALVYSTYLGGAGTEYARAIAVNSTGEAYITGTVSSTNFPTAHPIQSAHNGGTEGFLDAFVTKLNATGTALIYSTYLGGGSNDYGEDIALDSAGNAYVIGDTRSTCFPTTVGAFDTTYNGGDSDCFVLKISETAPPPQLTSCPSQLLNIGTRLRVLTGDSALIGGFIITGDDPKRVIIRGIGPSTNLPGALANPTLELYSSTGLRGSNDNWTSNALEVQATGIPPSHNLESAIVARLEPGAFTAVLRGHSNSTGIGLIEIYDLNPAEHALLANLSSRGFVDTGDDAIIGGFIVGGGSAPTRVLVRGIGPSLASFFPNALANPTLELRNADGSLIRSNDNWRDSQETEIQATGIPPTNNLESAIIASLGNGNYTAILRGKDNPTGMALVEIYNVE